MAEKDIIEERKEKLQNLLVKSGWIYYLILSIIVFIGVYLRTRNIPKLKDITTGTWTLGPDLDPFLFLRWAKDIVENGSLMVIDTMRYVPLGYNTAGEMKLLSYMIAWFYYFLSFFSKDVTVTYAAVIFPVFMFALTILAFFLFARKIFYKEDEKTKNIIALIATAFFALIPSLLPRTIAGIPEKESAAFFFMFIAFYFFLESFTSKKINTENKIKHFLFSVPKTSHSKIQEVFDRSIIFGILSGVATAGMALIWGGVVFIFLTIPISVLLAFILGKVKKEQFMIYSIWLISSILLMMPFSTRYTIKNIVMSISTGSAIAVMVLIGISLLIMKINGLRGIQKRTKLPIEIFSIIISVLILAIIVFVTLGPSFVYDKITDVKNSLITPMTDRFGLTVAENKQPYFINDWKNNFGPVFDNIPIPLFFWLFFIGAIALFNNLISKLNNKEKIILTLSYAIFLICLIFSRYSPDSIFNGISGLSLTLYFGGWLIFLGSFAYVYYKKYNDGGFSTFDEFNFNYILYFIILTLGIIGARGGIRLIMVLGAVSPIAVSFLIVKTSQKFLKEKDETMKVLIGIIVIIILLASVFTLIGNPFLMFKKVNFWGWGGYFQQDKITAENFAPGIYQWQWQKAMEWVRTNTSENAVFAHWWDYGYWLQSIGERATILDGGNAIGYWNHLIGRYVLTGTDEIQALEFLYAHNGTHLLIDSTEIGKYTAYSSIGSDENYDRFSWIGIFLMNDGQTQETKNETIYVYAGGVNLDEDIVWEKDGKEIFLPKKIAGIGAIILRKNQNEEILQPEGIFVYNGNQYRIPLRFAYFDKELRDYGSGLDAGIFLFPRLDVNPDGKANINNLGAAMYLSKRTVHSQLARLYLFDQKSDYFKLVHVEDNFLIDNIKKQGADAGEFLYYQGFQGPIKIWEITYPSDIKSNPDYLETAFPDERVRIAKSGEY